MHDFDLAHHIGRITKLAIVHKMVNLEGAIKKRSK
ncbi:Uncharacterised protein [uncultured archaeon]|nr:Uncharacterised protein [uncultured archaeon]